VRRAIAVLGLAVAAAGCASGPNVPARTASGELGERPVCAALPALLDLRHALGSTAAVGGSNRVGHLVDADEEIGRLRVARGRLRELGGAELGELDGVLAKLDASLEERRARIAAALDALRTSSDEGMEARGAAARCGEVDLREAGGSSPLPPACDAAARLWRSVRHVDLASVASCESVASHLGELRLDGKTGETRDAIAVLLRRHATALRDLDAAASGDDDRSVHDRSVTMVALEDTRSQCLGTMRTSDRVIGEASTPRDATVTVRPTWGDLESLGASRKSFGSGFVVRWRKAGGDVETRIVTNAHVMAGAHDARIAPGDATSGRDDDASTKGWKATLVSVDPVEDIAILRVETAAGEALRGGVQFRLEPAIEQEVVTAAGFPGVGMRPSFQVSKGTVSNAAFGSDDRAKTAVAFVQHTAPVDPGNSGGPLLDGEGRLMGMTTFKLVHRENVALAVPTPRILLAMLRADEARRVDARLAEATCNAVAAALSVETPPAEAMAAFGVDLFDPEAAAGSRAATWRSRVEGDATSPVDEARRRAYGIVRDRLESNGGVRPYQTCSDVRAIDDRFTSSPKLVGTLRTRLGSHQLTFAEEHGAIRLVSVR
jgi:S1-C subfamily serine protease